MCALNVVKGMELNMKRKIVILSILCVIFCTGCNPETGTMICTMSSYPTDGITLKSTYTATYKENTVTKLKTVEQVIADDKDNLDVYKERIEELYQGYQNIKYYTNKTNILGDTLTSTTVINYNKVDTEKLIKVDSNNGNIIKNGKVNIDDLRKMYEQNGCNCKKRK